MTSTGSLFREALVDYAQNLLLHSQLSRCHGLDDNALVLDALGRQGPLKDSSSMISTVRRYRAVATPRPISEPDEPIASNLLRLAEMLQLSGTDVAVFQFALAMSDSSSLLELVQSIGRIGTTAFARVVSSVIGQPRPDVMQSTSASGRLVRCGLIKLTPFGDLEDRLTPKDGILELLASPNLSRARLLERFLPDVAEGSGPWLEHSHLEGEIAAARGLLVAALRERARGINILLYGNSGTGKTELAKALARELGVPLYSSHRGEDASIRATERLSSLGLGLKLVEAGNGLVLFDELEDLFESSITSVLLGYTSAIAGKDSFNRILEDNPAPVIWTTNNIRHVDPAFLRRFSHAIHVRPGGVRQRARVLKHQLGVPTELPDSRLDALAEQYDASPAQVSAAVRAARLIDATCVDHISTFLDGTCRLLGGGATRRDATADEPEGYLIDAINASIDLDSLTDRLASWKHGVMPGVTMCLFGPPGTGKSEYVRHLARRLGRSVIVKRASDILGKYVGETEHRIARAFEDASIEDSILVFDEVDSLLRDRRDAFRSWEVTQVNEMLQQLESFPGIVACTTNRWDNLDPAVLRRFTFKIELKPPTADQAVRLFWKMFERWLDEPRSEKGEAKVRSILSTHRPTPGDLDTVRRRITVVGARPDLGQLLAEICAEVGARDDRAVGFQSDARR